MTIEDVQPECESGIVKPSELRAPNEFRRHLSMGAVWICVLVLSGFYVVLAAQAMGYGFEYDDAYHLNVVENLASGRGYVDDGVSYATTGSEFDPAVAAGPTLILPGALAWMISGGSIALVRLVLLAYFALYLVATAVLFARWGGRWAALAAAAAPSFFRSSLSTW